MSGRTTTKWIRFIVDDSTGVPREIPIDSISVVGFIYDEVDVTAWQDKVKGYLTNHPDCNIDITGPFDTSPLALIAGSGEAPILSGSYTVLQPLTDRTFTTPLGLSISIGDKGYWEFGDPVFGIPVATPTSGYICTKFTIEGEKYSARFVCDPSSPNWGTNVGVSIFGNDIVGNWNMVETSGTNANDNSGNNYDATYANVTLNNKTIPWGGKAPLFNASFLNIYSAGFAGAFDPDEYTILFWMASPDWETDTAGYICELYCDADNEISILKELASGKPCISNNRKANTTNINSFVYPGFVTTDWIMYANSVSVSGDYSRIYINGYREQTYTGLAAWDGTGLNTNATGFGAFNTSYTSPVTGDNLCHITIFNRALTDAEIESIYKMALAPKILTILGDSIPETGDTRWHNYLDRDYTYKLLKKNHSVSGAGVIAGTNMDAQTVSAASDDADMIIIALGVNDNDAGDMGVLQAEFEENLIEIHASNPKATIYVMNVLPVWTDIGGGTPVDKSHIRTAIAAACTARGVTCWDTFTVPWITSAQTLDGLHPNKTGHAAIATKILALLP